VIYRAEHSVRHYLDVLNATFMARGVNPFFGNLAKRQVKAPKVYLADTGILHSLLDLLVVRGERRLGFEVKRSDSPRVTPSMRSALQNLALERLDVVHAGPHKFAPAEGIRALALKRVLVDLERLC
jgi:hypothetical protein